MTTEKNLILSVPNEASGQRVDQFIANQLPDLSRSRVRHMLDKQEILVDDRAVKAAQRLRWGQVISLHIPAPQSAIPQGEEMDLDVIFEDEDVLVINKAAGLVMHPAPGHPTGTLVNGLIGRFGQGFSVGGEMRPGIVHRLDKGTTGLVIIARNDASLAALQQQFQAREIDKYYMAVVAGDPGREGHLDTPYGRHPHKRKLFSSRHDGARRARLSFTRLEQFAGASLIEVKLGTGRSHQIRVQFADRAHPLLGDIDYGGAKRSLPFHRPALHAFKLGFMHPRLNKRMDFLLPLPQDMQKLLEDLRALST